VDLEWLSNNVKHGVLDLAPYLYYGSNTLAKNDNYFGLRDADGNINVYDNNINAIKAREQFYMQFKGVK